MTECQISWQLAMGRVVILKENRKFHVILTVHRH